MEVPLVTCEETPDVSLADGGEVVLDLGPVVVGDARRDGRVGHQLVNAGRFEDVGGVLLQCLVVADHAVVYFTRGTQLRVSHPVNNVLAKLSVQAAAALRVAQVTDKVVKVQSRRGEAAVAVALAVFADDGRSDVMFIPRLEARVLHKLVLECRNEPLKGIPHNEELKVGV